jgi:hypothetical protein
MLAEAPEVAVMAPLVEQKLSDGSSFKGNAAGYLERRSDIIKSWYVIHVSVIFFRNSCDLQGAQICCCSGWRCCHF